MDIQELKTKVSKIINDEKVPNEVKQKLEDLYKEYEQACAKCKYLLTTISNKDNMEEIEEICQYIKDDTESNKETIDSVNIQEYEIKKEKLMERINMELDKLEGKTTQLQPILFDNKEESYRENKANIENWEADRLSIEAFINEVMNNIIIELESSRRYIKLKIDNLGINGNDEQLVLVKTNIKRRFEEDVETVISKIKKEVPELGKVLEAQNSKIYKYIEDEIKAYEKENSQEKTSEEQVADFRKRLEAKVNEEEAIIKADENKKTVTLDENIIS